MVRLSNTIYIIKRLGFSGVDIQFAGYVGILISSRTSSCKHGHALGPRRPRPRASCTTHTSSLEQLFYLALIMAMFNQINTYGYISINYYTVKFCWEGLISRRFKGGGAEASCSHTLRPRPRPRASCTLLLLSSQILLSIWHVSQPCSSK